MKLNHFVMEDVLESLIDYRGRTPQKSDDGIPTLSAKSVKNGYIDYSECYYISPEEYKKFMVRGFPKVGDILLTTEAPMGMVARLDRDDVAIAQRLITLRGKEGILDNDYLLYYLQSPLGQHKLAERETGSTVTGIKQAAFRKIEIDIPDIDVQKKISACLSCIDAKIETNKRINRNLQEQAFALFDHMIAEHSSGDVCNLSDFADINPKRNLSKNTEARCIDMAKLSTSGAFPDGWDYKTYTGGMKFKNGDTILARITPCLENGKTAYINFLEVDEVAFGSTEYIVLAPKGVVPSELLYCLARYPRFVDYAVINMNGTSGRQRVSGEIIGQYQVPRFTKIELEEFASSVTVSFEKMKQNSMESMRLAEVRNILLPKLMSGELDVSDIKI